MGFGFDDVVTRDQRFLEYAYEQGAAIGGATGAGGEAPKLLLSEGRDGLLYPDAVLDDGQAICHWFVKFARNQALNGRRPWSAVARLTGVRPVACWSHWWTRNRLSNACARMLAS